MNPVEQHLKKELFNVTAGTFDALALQLFLFQYENNSVYRQYCKTLKIIPAAITSLQQIPFLPIRFFKTKNIMTGSFQPQAVFESSGTTGSTNSLHVVKELSLYEESFVKSFTHFYGDISQYCILGLLPSYLQKGNSSLVYMVNKLIKCSSSTLSGFYLDDYKKLYETIAKNEDGAQKALLIGVTYALLDFAEQYQPSMCNTIVMETGGMKGRRKELTREQVHQKLKQRLGISAVHSEYGMTELLSQAYSHENGKFICPAWMKVLIRADDDPFMITVNLSVENNAAEGLINIIDLANLYSCAFIATDDLGKLDADGSFEVRGRMDNSDIRGCGLMIL